MIATMIPISGDPWYIEINEATPKMCVTVRNDSPIDYYNSSPATVLRNTVVYKLIAYHTLVYQEQLGRI